MKVCGLKKCKTSTGIHGGVTHGWGELHHLGFWEHECGPCTRSQERVDKARAWALRWKRLARELLKLHNAASMSLEGD